MKKFYIIFIFTKIFVFADNICKNNDIVYEHFICQKVEQALFDNKVKDYLIQGYTSALVSCSSGLFTKCNPNKYYNKNKIANNYILERFSSIESVEFLANNLGRAESQSTSYKLDYQTARIAYNQNILSYNQADKKYKKDLVTYNKQQDLIKRYNSINYQKCLKGQITNSYGNAYPAIACQAIAQSWTLIDTIPRNRVDIIQEPIAPIEPKFKFPDYSPVFY